MASLGDIFPGPGGNGTSPPLFPVAATGLKERFLRACELKQAVDWGKIEACFQQWAAVLKLDPPTIVRVESVEQFQKALKSASVAKQASDSRNKDQPLTTWQAQAMRKVSAARDAKSVTHLVMTAPILAATRGGTFQTPLGAASFAVNKCGGTEAHTGTEQSVPWSAIVAIGAAEFGDLAEFLNWYPLFEAFEAGAYSFFIAERGIEVCPIPSVVKVDERHVLHSASGPAFEWLGEVRDFYWQGVQVERRVIEDPESITVAEIEAELHADVRRVKIERMGQTRPAGEMPRISSVTVEELQERFIRACELKQTVDWEKINGYFRRWAAICGIEVSAIVRIEAAVHLKKAEMNAWMAGMARYGNPSPAAAAVHAAERHAFLHQSWTEMARNAESGMRALLESMARQGKGVTVGVMAQVHAMYEKRAREARLQEAATEPTAAIVTKETWTKLISPVITAASAVRVTDRIWGGKTVLDGQSRIIGRDVTTFALAAVEALENNDPGVRFSSCYQLFKAFEAGAFRFYITDNRIEVCTIPVVASLDERGRSHSATGPAFVWLDDVRLFFWHGVQVADYVVEQPERITVVDIDTESNLEVRRVKLERLGPGRYLADSSAQEIHRDEFGILYRKEFAGDEPLVMVNVVNATPEADGSFKDYFLRVPPTVRTAREAVAWTFGKPPTEYGPAEET